MKGAGNRFLKISITKIFGSQDSISWIFLLGAAPFFMMIQPKFSWILLFIPLTWLITLLAKRKPFPTTPFNLAFLIMSIQVLISLYATYDIAFSLQKVTGVIWGMTVFFSLLRLSQKHNGILISSLVYLVGGAGILVLGLLGIEWPTNKIILFNTIYKSIPSLSSIIPGIQDSFHPNEVGGATTWIVLFLITITFWLLLRFNTIRKVLSPLIVGSLFIVFIFLSSLGTIVLLFSQSRSAYIGMVIGLVALLLLVLPKYFKIVFVFLLVIGAGYLIYSFQNGQLMMFINQLFPDSGMASMAFSMSTLSGRVEIWARAIYAIQDFAFTGMGMNTFRTIVNVLYPLQTITPDVPIKDIGHAHNLFLQTALDLGIPGLIAFIGIYMISFWMLITNIRRMKRVSSKDSNIKKLIQKEFFFIISIGLFSSQIAHLAFGMTDAIAFGAKPGIIFWVMQSMICGIYLKVCKHDYL